MQGLLFSGDIYLKELLLFLGLQPHHPYSDVPFLVMLFAGLIENMVVIAA